MSAKSGLWHFGVLPFTGTGHLNPLILLAQQLRDRGHKVTFFEKPKIQSRVLQAGLEFVPVGAGASPLKWNGPTGNNVSLQSEFSRLRFNLKRIARDLEIYLEDTPAALMRCGVDALLVNEVALTGPTLAEMLRLPYFIISTSVPHSFGWNAYSRLSGYRYSSSWLSLFENALLEVSALRLHGPIRRTLDEYRRHRGLGPVGELARLHPPLAHITQLPQCLDLPRTTLPSNFHYTGPFVSRVSRPRVVFPWDQLDGRPIIYVSLGTTRNVQASVFRMIAQACLDLDMQIIISLGGRIDSETMGELPGSPLVTAYAPQLQLLKLASIVITHGGANTVFETLMEGKPMVVIPLALDQPAIAARLARLKLAEVLPVMRLSPMRIRIAVTSVLNDPRYRDAAVEMQTKLKSLHGLTRAVEVIERALEEQMVCARIGTISDSPATGPDVQSGNSATVSIAPR